MKQTRRFTDWSPFMKKRNGYYLPVIAKDYRVIRELPVLVGCRAIAETITQVACRHGWGSMNKGKFLRKATPCEWTSAHDELVRRQEFKGCGVKLLYDST